MSGRIRLAAGGAIAAIIAAVGVGGAAHAAEERETQSVAAYPEVLTSQALADDMMELLAGLNPNLESEAIQVALHRYLLDAARAAADASGTLNISDSDEAIAGALAILLVSDLTPRQLTAVRELFQVYSAPDIPPPSASRVVARQSDETSRGESKTPVEALGPPPTVEHAGGSDYEVH